MHLDATEHLALALMLGVFENAGTECRFIGKHAGMAV